MGARTVYSLWSIWIFYKLVKVVQRAKRDRERLDCGLLGRAVQQDASMRARLSGRKLIYLLCRKSNGKNKRGEMRMRPMDWTRSTTTMTRINFETWRDGSRQNMYVDDKNDFFFFLYETDKRLIVSRCLRERLLWERKGTSMTITWTWVRDTMKTTPSSTILMLYVKFLFFLTHKKNPWSHWDIIFNVIVIFCR